MVYVYQTIVESLTRRTGAKRPTAPDAIASLAIASLPKESVSFSCVFQESHHSNHFQTSALTSLDRLPDRSTWIEITGLRIDRLPAYAFFRFGNSLRILELRDCSIDAIEPGAFAGLHQLQRLVLIGNRLPAVAAHWFGDLVALQQLVLARNAIERVEPGALRPLAGSLRHLDMRYNRLQCLSPEELAHLSRLQRLDAVGNPWNCECRRNLQRALMERNVGFEISGGRCYENENEVGEVDDRGQHWLVSGDSIRRTCGSKYEMELEDKRNEASHFRIFSVSCIFVFGEKIML